MKAKRHYTQSDHLSFFVTGIFIVVMGLPSFVLIAGEMPKPPGSLTVLVTDQGTRTPVAGADVDVTWAGKTESVLKKAAKTDVNGEVYFAALPGQFGKYDVHVSGSGYAKIKESIELLFDQPGIVLNVKLRPENWSEQWIQFRLSSAWYKDNELQIKFNNNTQYLSQKDNEGIVGLETKIYTDRDVDYHLLGPNIPMRAAESTLQWSFTGDNVPTWDFMCGGLALANLFGKAIRIPTGMAAQIIGKFAMQVTGTPQIGDMVMWRKNNQPTHFAWVCKVVRNTRPMIITKDNAGLIWEGYLDQFPKNPSFWNKFKAGVAEDDYGEYALYRLDWDGIDVERMGDQVPQVPAAPGPVSWTGESKYSNPPPPKAQKAFIDACNEIMSKLNLRPYTIKREQVGWIDAEWGSSFEGSSWKVSLGVNDSSRMGEFRTAKQEAVKYVQDRIASWSRTPSYAKNFTPPPVQMVQISGEPGGQKGPQKGITEFVWSSGKYMFQVKAAINLFEPGKSYDNQTAQELAQKAQKTSLEHASLLRDILAAKATENKLSLPLRPFW